jgi:plastocyanin
MRVTILLAALVLALAGCGSDDEASPSSGGGGATRLALEDNTFDPATIEGEPGSKVQLDLENTGKAEHTFTVDSQKIDEEVEPGATATVSVTIPDSGSVEFYCRYHRGGGMVGTLGEGGEPSQEKGKGAYY